VLGDGTPAKPVYQCEVRAAPGDPVLGDDAWMRIAGEIMHRTGLSRHGEEDDGVRWVAVHHGANHIHIVATLARQDGRRVRLHNDWYRIGEVLRDIEAEYGLRRVTRAGPGKTAGPPREGRPGPSRRRRPGTGRPEPPRMTLRRQVAVAATGGRAEPEFFADLDKRGLLVRLRHSC